MPAGQSILGIYNIALISLGEDPLSALTDDVKAAKLCNARYQDVRQACIREHNWGCCKKLAQLAADPVAPPFDWDVRFPLPADYIRFYGVMDTDGRTLDDTDWEVVGPFLMTDAGGPLNAMYFFDLQDPTRFDAFMAQVMGYELALEIAPSIGRDEAKIARVERQLASKLSAARFSGAIEDSAKEWQVDVLLRSRR